MAPRRLLLLVLVAIAAASSMPAASPVALHAAHEPAEPPSRELPAADPAAQSVAGDADAVLPGACGGLVIIPPHTIRAAVPAGPGGVYDVTVVLRATLSGGQYHVVPGSVGGDGEHREEFLPMLLTDLALLGLCFIFLFCLEMMVLGLRGDGGDDEAYSGGGGDGAVPMKSVLVDTVHADAVKVEQHRGDN